MSNTSHQLTTATRVNDPDSDPSRATSYHVTKTSPPVRQNVGPTRNHQPKPLRTALQICLIGVAECQRVLVEPRIAVAIQSAWCFPTAADLASQAAPLPFITARQWRSQFWPIPDRASIQLSPTQRHD